MHPHLANRVALVTGGGGGLGSAVARCLHAMGVTVFVAGRRRHVLDAACQGASGMHPVVLDVTDERSWAAAVDSIEHTAGSVGILVTSAAVITRAPFAESPPSAWEEMWRTNVLGSMLGVRAVLGGMRSRGWGRIVLVSSTGAVLGLPDRAAYCATKGAVEAFGRALAVDIAGSGVTVNIIAPGAFRTEINADAFDDAGPATKRLLGRIPEGRFGETGELAAAVEFLMASSYSQGSTVTVDGGWSVQG